MIDKSAATTAYVRFVLEHLKLTPSALAKLAKISSSTVTRLLNDDSYTYSLSVSSLEKIAEASGYSYIPFLEAQDAPTLAAASLRSAVNRGFKTPSGTLDRLVGTTTPLIGSVRLGVWFDAAAWTSSTLTYLPLAMKQPGEKRFAFKVEGSGCSLVAAEGEVLLCSRMEDAAYPDERLYGRPKTEMVVVERHTKMNGRSLCEVSARFVQIHDGSRSFRLATDDADLVAADEAVERSGVETRIIGLVHYIIRRPVPPDDA